MTDETTFEGVARFPSRANSSYRYKLKANSDSMSVWLEDRGSKNQWTSGALQLSDFVDSKNAISQASMADYVSCFQNCLESTHSEPMHSKSKAPMNKPSENEHDADSSCNLVPLDKDTWSLRFVLALKVFASVWRSTYAISLKPVQLQPIDSLAAQLRDVQEEMKQLRGGEARVSYELHLESTQRTGHRQPLKWSVVDKDNGDDSTTRFSVDKDSKVRFLESGVYVVSLALGHVYNYDPNQAFHCELQRNGFCIEAFIEARTSSVTISYVCVVAMGKGQSLTVVNKGQNYVDVKSTMTIAPLK